MELKEYRHAYCGKGDRLAMSGPCPCFYGLWAVLDKEASISLALKWGTFFKTMPIWQTQSGKLATRPASVGRSHVWSKPKSIFISLSRSCAVNPMELVFKRRQLLNGHEVRPNLLNCCRFAGVLLLQVFSSGLGWTAASQVKLFHADKQLFHTCS